MLNQTPSIEKNKMKKNTNKIHIANTSKKTTYRTPTQNPIIT
jgi:hypothetical protein